MRDPGFKVDQLHVGFLLQSRDPPIEQKTKLPAPWGMFPPMTLNHFGYHHDGILHS
jgi:hypothetical protein